MKNRFCTCRTRAIAAFFLCLTVGVSGCDPADRAATTRNGGNTPSPTAVARRPSEYDFYSSLRPRRADPHVAADGTAVAGDVQPFAPTVYQAMKTRGYQVYLITYRYSRPADPFGPNTGGLLAGFGLRDFFAMPAITAPSAMDPSSKATKAAPGTTPTPVRNPPRNALVAALGIERPPSPRVITGQRAAVVWETRRGEFWLVDRYGGVPTWLDGATWLDKVRFYDHAADGVTMVERSGSITAPKPEVADAGPRREDRSRNVAAASRQLPAEPRVCLNVGP